MKKIPLFKTNLPPREELIPYLSEVLYSGYIAEGEQVKAFEMQFGEYIGNPNVVCVNSCTAALHIALILTGVKPGDEVISTPATALPTNQAIMMAGGRIVWADVDPGNGNISPTSIRKNLSANTKAIVVVDYAGNPVQIDDIMAIAAQHAVPVIEDAAHALGAEYDGKKVGNHADYVTFSFQAIKHITTVDGGALICKSADKARDGKLARWFGIDKSKNRMDPNSGFDISTVGYKYHMNNVTAAIGLVQMKHIAKTITAHQDNAAYYNKHLTGVPGLEICYPYEKSVSSYWLYTVKVERRDAFIKHLDKHGIAAAVVHPRNDLYSLFKTSLTSLPGVDAFYEKMVHIPVGLWVTEEDRERIVSTIQRGW